MCDKILGGHLATRILEHGSDCPLSGFDGFVRDDDGGVDEIVRGVCALAAPHDAPRLPDLPDRPGLPDLPDRPALPAPPNPPARPALPHPPGPPPRPHPRPLPPPLRPP